MEVKDTMNLIKTKQIELEIEESNVENYEKELDDLLTVGEEDRVGILAIYGILIANPEIPDIIKGSQEYNELKQKYDEELAKVNSIHES